MTLKNEPDKKIVLYNPDSDDFVCTYDVDGNGSPETFVLKAREVGTYAKYLGEHIKKHLVNHLIIKWNKSFTDAVEIKKINELVDLKI